MTDPKHPCMRLADGRILPLPLPLNVHEFGLAGNAREFSEFLSFFDPMSGTGALFYPKSATWQLVTPTTRDVFAQHCELLARFTADDAVAALALQPAVH